MTKMSVLVERSKSAYRVSFDLGKYLPVLKFDTGAKYSVISVKSLDDRFTLESLEHFKEYCEQHSLHKEKFISASGDSFYGYLVSVSNAIVGGTSIPNFRYYIVLENMRDIALLGFDFIDRCSFFHNASGDIVLTEFDEEAYGTLEGAMNSDEVIAFMDSLVL